MTVIELARRAGITPAAVRFYIRAGVLGAPHVLAGGGHGYDETDALRLGLAVGLHRLGILPARETSRPPEQSATANTGGTAATER